MTSHLEKLDTEYNTEFRKKLYSKLKIIPLRVIILFLILFIVLELHGNPV